MPDWGFVRIHDGEADWLGYETGVLTVVTIQGDVLVLKEGGHKVWSALHSPWRYEPAKYHVLRVVGVRQADGALQVAGVVEFPARS